MKIETLEDLFVQELRDIYSAENQITQALPEMIENARTPELREAFEEHLQVTRGQLQRLDRIFTELGVSPKGKDCVGMEGILDEGKEFMKNDTDDSVLEAGMIASAQKVEHYEIAAYGTVTAFAKMLGHDGAANLLHQSLEEEKETDRLLTEIAESSANLEARDGDGEEEFEEDEEEDEK